MLGEFSLFFFSRPSPPYFKESHLPQKKLCVSKVGFNALSPCGNPSEVTMHIVYPGIPVPYLFSFKDHVLKCHLRNP